MSCLDHNIYGVQKWHISNMIIEEKCEPFRLNIKIMDKMSTISACSEVP